MTSPIEQSMAGMPSLASRAWPEGQYNLGHLKARYAMRGHALQQFSEVLQKEGASALLVKGAALADTLYPVPWARAMADIDVIVKRADIMRVRAALGRAGWDVSAIPGRPLTEACLEMAARSPKARGSVLLELHLGLDKVVLRPVDITALFSRAEPVQHFPGVFTPSREDHVVLIALHLAADEFRHLPGFVDLELLFSSRLDLHAVIDRARSWRATTALYVALRTLDTLRPALVPPDLINELAPSRAQAALLSTTFDVGAWPVARAPTELGWKWIASQTPLRDDTLRWILGLGTYAARRAVERLGAGSSRH